MQPPAVGDPVMRPAHLTLEKQNTVIDRVLKYVLVRNDDYKFEAGLNFDLISLYDPPIYEDGFPKIVRIPRDFFWNYTKFYFLNNPIIDLTFCQIDLNTLAFLMRVNRIGKIITTLDVRPAKAGDRLGPSDHSFDVAVTELQVVRNVFWNVAPLGSIFAGVRFDPDETPHKGIGVPLDHRWTDLLLGRSDPEKRIYPSLKAAAKVQAVATKTETSVTKSKTSSLLTKLDKFLEGPKKKPAAEKPSESFREVPFNRPTAVKALAHVFAQSEGFIETNIQNLELFICLTGTENGFPMNLRITREAMLKSLLPLAIKSQTRELNFDGCQLDEHVLVDLLENLADLFVDYVLITRKLSRYEGMALFAQKELIERRRPENKQYLHLIYYQPESKSKIKYLSEIKDIVEQEGIP